MIVTIVFVSAGGLGVTGLVVRVFYTPSGSGGKYSQL